MKKWILSILLGLAIIAGGLWGGGRLLHAMGEREIYLAAQENAYCHDEACDDGMARLVFLLERETGIKAEFVPWCMAANSIYTTKFIVLDRLKEQFADWMYRSCQNEDLTIEDAVLSIGEPED